MAHRLEQLELHDVIGSGGMATVYGGIHLPSGNEVAVKIMTSNLARDARYRRAFLREVRSVGRLTHPNIVRVLDSGEIPPELERDSGGEFDAGAPYLVMERAHGGSLDQHHELTWSQLREITFQLLDALAHAHARRVIHRDLKPSNIMLDTSNDEIVTKLTDFGIARLFDINHPSDPSDGDRRISGTPKYMAPERVMGLWRDQGPWTDLYSLGVLIWRAVTGEQPFQGTTREVLVSQVRDSLPLFEPVVDVPERLEAWLRGLLAKSPFRRFRRAADAAVAFDRACRSPMLTDGLRENVVPIGGADRRTPPSLPTLTTIVERDTEEAYLRQHGLVTDWPRPAMPTDWRGAEARPAADSISTGLGLFGIRSIPLVGREAHRDSLWTELRHAVDERKLRIVHLRGPAGAGKTRLAQWLAERAAELGVVDVLRAIPSRGGSGEGLGGLLERTFRCEELDDVATLVRVRELLRELTQGKDQIAEYDAPAIAQMIRAGEETRPSIDFVSPAERFHVILRLLRRLGVSRTPILWIDDAHQASELIHLVRFLIRHAMEDFPVLVVLTSRIEGPFVTESLHRELTALESSPECVTISVGPMPADELRQLVRHTLGLEPHLADDVVRLADGSPMFVTQIVDDWVQRQALTPSENGFVLGETPNTLPDDVHEIWIGRLNEAVRTLGSRSSAGLDALLLAAMLGLRVNTREWTDCLARFVQTTGSIEPLLDELQRVGLADGERDGWSFAHPMMRESLLRIARVSGRWSTLHRACADALGARADVHMPMIALRVAYHLFESDQQRASLELLAQTITLSKARHDFDWLERLLEAAERVASALRLAPSDPMRGLLDVSAARLLSVGNRLMESKATLNEVVERARRHNWSHVEGEATFMLGSNALARGRTDDAIEFFRHAQRMFADLGEAQNLASATEGVGYAYLHQGRFREAKDFIVRAGALYEDLEDPRGLSFNLFHKGIIARYEGDLVGAREFYKRSMQVAGTHGFRDNIANAYNAMGDLDRYAGDFEQARRHYTSARDLWAAIGAAAQNMAEINLSLTLVQQGRWNEAEALLEPLTRRLRFDQAHIQLTFALAAMLPVHVARREEALFDLALEGFEAFLVSNSVHDPDLDLLCDVCVELWESVGDDTRAAQTRRVFELSRMP